MLGRSSGSPKRAVARLLRFVVDELVRLSDALPLILRDAALTRLVDHCGPPLALVPREAPRSRPSADDQRGRGDGTAWFGDAA